jgi:hypothetical protein
MSEHVLEFAATPVAGTFDGQRAVYECRAELEALDLNDVRWQTPETFDDGDALFEAACAVSRLAQLTKLMRKEPANQVRSGWLRQISKNPAN